MTLFEFLSKFMDENILINEYDKEKAVYKNVFKGRIYDLIDNRKYQTNFKNLLKTNCFCAYLNVNETLVINIY